MNSFLLRKVISYLTQDEIESYRWKFRNNLELKKAYDLLVLLGINGFYGFDGSRNFEKACYEGNRFGIHKIIQKNPLGSVEFWQFGLSGACRGGHRDLVDLMIKKGANNWNSGLFWACRGGWSDLVDLMIRNGADDWNRGLYGACQSDLGVKTASSLIDLMIKQGADDLNRGLRYACYGGHLDLVNLMIQKGANDWDQGLRGACQNGCLDLVMLMIEYGATDLDSGFECACCGYHSFDRSENKNKDFFKNNIAIMLLLIQKGAVYCRWCSRPPRFHFSVI